jgi:hypothetical protein
MTLIRAMIRQSDNTAANALISHFGFAANNATCGTVSRAREGIDTIAKATSCNEMIEIMLGQEDRDKIPAGAVRRRALHPRRHDEGAVRLILAILALGVEHRDG